MLLADSIPTSLVALAAGLLVMLFAAARFRRRRRQELRQRLLEVMSLAAVRELPLPALVQRTLKEHRGRDRRALRSVHRILEGGEPVSRALAGAGRCYFPSHILGAVRSAESCGRLAPVLASLASNETAALSMRHRAQMTLAYPLLLALALLLIGGATTHGAIGELREHVEMSLAGAGGFDIGRWSVWAGPIAGGLVFAIVLLTFVLRPLGVLPGAVLLGGARVLRCAAPLASAGVSLHEIFRRAAPAAGQRRVERAVAGAAGRLEEGEDPAEVWGALPLPAFVRERAGLGSRLSPARYGVLLEDLSLECARRHAATIERWLRWAGPILILLLGVAVLLQYGALMKALDLARESVWKPW